MLCGLTTYDMLTHKASRLAAVDMHTAQHLVKHALTGSLARGRTIILVTHHISLCLPKASYLVELSGGSVIRQGSTQALREQGELTQLVEAEDVVPEEAETSESSSTTIENEADLDDQVTPADEDTKRASGKLIEAEARAEGRVSAKTYWTYIRAAGLFCWFFTMVLMVLVRLITIANQVSLTQEDSCGLFVDYLPAVHRSLG